MTPPKSTPKSTNKPLTHHWIANAQITLDPKVAKAANFRGSFVTKETQRIDVLDVMCKDCRRPMDDVADQPCAAKIDNTHLIGGDQSVRAKRKHTPLPEGAVVMPGPRINRYGIGAVLNREA